jgi:hypothetical protein
MLASFAILAATATIPPSSSSAWTAQKPAVRKAIEERYGRNVRIDSVLVKGQYAVARGNNFHAGLKLTGDTWHITCELTGGPFSATVLTQRCGFPSTVATQLAAEEPINLMASQGNFHSAAGAEQQLYTTATGPAREEAHVRYQTLTRLDTEMRLQQITRDQAIQQWNQVRFSWSLP